MVALIYSIRVRQRVQQSAVQSLFANYCDWSTNSGYQSDISLASFDRLVFLLILTKCKCHVKPIESRIHELVSLFGGCVTFDCVGHLHGLIGLYRWR
jgi:hypothetical protein